MKKTYAVGIDIGGTKILGVALKSDRVVFRSEKKYAHKPPRKSEFLRTLFFVLDELTRRLPARAISGIGIGSPGLITGNTIYGASNVPPLRTLSLVDTVRKRHRLPTRLDNDVKTAARAEYRYGAGKGKNTNVMITLGTGIGGAYTVNGIIQRGAFTNAYEMGHMYMGIRTGLQRGIGDFEWFASERFFLSRGTDPERANLLARRGNAHMKRLWRTYGEYLGTGIASIINLLEPEVFIIGGSMAQAWPLFAPTMKKTARRLIISPPARKKTKIVPAKLGRDAGAIGAALLVSEPTREKLPQ